MALWLVRTGKHGEHEQQFFKNNRIYLTWDGMNHDLARLKTPEEFRAVQQRYFPDQLAIGTGSGAGAAGR